MLAATDNRLKNTGRGDKQATANEPGGMGDLGDLGDSQPGFKRPGTVGKALVMLDIVESFHQPVRFNTILAKSPYPKASTYRLLQTLVTEKMLSFNPGSGYYLLGQRLIALAHSAWRHASLAPIAAPFLDALAATTKETIHLAQLDNGHVLYLDKRSAARPIAMFSDAGKVGPAYCTGIGKAMLAYCDTVTRERWGAQQSFYAYTHNSITSAQDLQIELERIRQAGIAFDREEHEANIICIAAPILSQDRQLLGGLSITSSTLRTDLNGLANYKATLQQSAGKIGAQATVWMLPKMRG